ncbi:MAG TPA: class I SAM-dependent methyltransferase, partial [Clostridiaceae bacterium]|nr:class I SAM-dependent methyltransferase [Clostridiaceae bacterium]
MSQYTGIAEVYDRLIDMDYDGWENFLVEFFNKEGFSYKGKKCLELGCGTGNMTLRLKKIGFEVYGMDISEDMMCVAQEKLMEENLRAVLLNQDMTDFSIDKSFSCIFSFCDGYNYITDENKLINSFKNVYSHLNDGGYFIFDVSSEYKLKNI